MFEYNIWVFSVPPSNMNVETKPYTDEYYGNIMETINCTANMNPSTTVLSLVGKGTISSDKYVFAERKNLQIFVDSENKTDCNPTVRVVFIDIFYFVKVNNFVACFANDTVTGQSFMTEFKVVGINDPS